MFHVVHSMPSKQSSAVSYRCYGCKLPILWLNRRAILRPKQSQDAAYNRSFCSALPQVCSSFSPPRFKEPPGASRGTASYCRKRPGGAALGAPARLPGRPPLACPRPDLRRHRAHSALLMGAQAGSSPEILQTPLPLARSGQISRREAQASPRSRNLNVPRGTSSAANRAAIC